MRWEPGEYVYRAETPRAGIFLIRGTKPPVGPVLSSSRNGERESESQLARGHVWVTSGTRLCIGGFTTCVCVCIGAAQRATCASAGFHRDLWQVFRQGSVEIFFGLGFGSSVELFVFVGYSDGCRRFRFIIKKLREINRVVHQEYLNFKKWKDVCVCKTLGMKSLWKWFYVKEIEKNCYLWVLAFKRNVNKWKKILECLIVVLRVAHQLGICCLFLRFYSEKQRIYISFHLNASNYEIFVVEMHKTLTHPCQNDIMILSRMME